MRRFTITASERAVYQIEIEANTRDEAMKHFYENMEWLEPVEYADFQIEHVAMGDEYEETV